MKSGFYKILSVLMCVFLIGASVSVAFAAEGTLAGSGTETDPYLIKTAADFAAVAANPGTYNEAYLELGADITLSSLTPIGTADAPFKGHFNGAGHSIKGKQNDYEIEDYEAIDCGIFGYAEGAEIANVKLLNINLSCGDNVGCLVGRAIGTTISNVCLISCAVDANAVAGGVVGYMENSTVSDCDSDCAISLYDGNCAGGIAGKAVNSDILRCKHKGSISIENLNCGGIVGQLNSGKISHCINQGDVLSSGTSFGDAVSMGVGGIVGIAKGEISYCGNAGNVTSEQDCGGVFAYGTDVTVDYCYSAGKLTASYLPVDDNTIGNAASGTVTNCVGVNDAATQNKLTTKEEFDGWDFENTWFESSSDPQNTHRLLYPILRDSIFHTFTQTVQNPTCTKNGNITDTCICGCVVIETINKLGHDWDDGVFSPKPTCLEDGQKTFTCKRCGDTKTEPAEKTPDEHTDLNNDNICDVCGKTIKEEEAGKRNFFQKIGDFFRRIIEWIKNLFKRK